jgi:bifunctional DNA-binding transcriptional regulator/antitoxin component of YhaV-PrlF toxin-antitoxin module
MAKPQAKMLPKRPDRPAPHIVKVGPKGVITIPEENRAVMGIQPGQYLTAMQVGNMLILSPEINQFLEVAAAFQQKMADAGLTPDSVMAGLAESREDLYQRLYGGATQA